MLVSLHQGLFSYCGKIRDSCSVFRGARLLQTVSLITAGGSAAFGISAARGVIPNRHHLGYCLGLPHRPYRRR